MQFVLHILLSILALIVFAGGIASYRAAWLCQRAPERAGWWADVKGVLAVVTFLATTTAPMMFWVQGDGSDFMMGVLRFLFYAVSVMLYVPYLTFHAGALLIRLLRHESQPPPEPEDPFERAVAAEERGDVRGAVERYWILLEEEPGHVEGRTRLARLLGRTRRVAQAVEVVEQGLALDELPSVDKADWKVLLRDLKDGKLGETAPEPADGEELPFRGHIAGPSAAGTVANGEDRRDRPEDGPEDERPIEL